MSVLLNKDCLEALKEMPSDSVDSLITDPPAGISFMGKAWDEDKGGRKQWITWMQSIMTECYRVLKPGAHGLVWAIPRTSHWTATALEDAGFEIRDVVTHIFGSGFPKSLNISKAIDNAYGTERIANIPNPHFVAGRIKGYAESAEGTELNSGLKAQPEFLTSASTPEAKQWDGWGTALKPASEHWVLVRKPISEKTVAANTLKHGVGGINIDASRVGVDGETERASQEKTKTATGWTTGHEINEINKGRFPANLILSHNPDCVEVGVKKVKTSNPNSADGMIHSKANQVYGKRGDAASQNTNYASPDGTEIVASFECTPDCAVAALDKQSGISKSTDGLGDSGGASRFFYVAKASKKDKNRGLEGLPLKESGIKNSSGRGFSEGDPNKVVLNQNSHPTVKSSTLMAYLIKLITPPLGVVLDPFMGSGSTGVAAIREGFRFTGIEKEAEYYNIAFKRIQTEEGEDI